MPRRSTGVGRAPQAPARAFTRADRRDILRATVFLCTTPLPAARCISGCASRSAAVAASLLPLATAASKVPGTTLKGAEIDREDGKLLYVFSFTKAGSKGEDEVSVDALTGALHKVEHESAEDEAREAAEDAAKAKGKSTRTTEKSAAPAKTTKPPIR